MDIRFGYIANGKSRAGMLTKENQQPKRNWVVVEHILQRMYNARTSNGKRDNYMAIETDLENAIKGR